MAANDEEENDPREGPLHPRHRHDLLGHLVAEKHLADAYRSGRFHHAWLITGAEGIGKATLAYRLARYILANPDQAAAPADNLSIAADNPVVSQINARSHPDLKVLERAVEKGKLKASINVESTRKVVEFFNKTAAAGGWRVGVVDAADDMNGSAANALLKCLEEPPQDSVFILVCHQRGRLLPTIRSRCIELPLKPLSADQTSAVLAGLPEGLGKEAARFAQIAGGRPGLALALAQTGAGSIFKQFTDAAASGGADMSTRMKIAGALHGRGTDDRFSVFCALLDDWITAAAAAAARQPESGKVAHALSKAHEAIGHSIREANALNLDRRMTLLHAFDLIERARRA